MQIISPIKCENNIGIISLGSPFQIFGAIPLIGSYCRISSNKFFANGVKNLMLEIDWLDLPQHFADYYEAYNKIYSFTNQSFQVNFSLDTYRSTSFQLINHDTLSLFTEDPSTGNILTKSYFCLDAKDLLLAAKLLSSNEDELLSDKIEWGIRIELTSPEVGFGHKIFPTLLAETVLNNSKWYKRKRKVPNQPYVPFVNHITIYTN